MAIEGITDLVRLQRPATLAPAAFAFPESPAAPPAVDDARLDQAVERANRLIGGAAHNLQFRIDQSSGKAIAQVIDTETGDVVRQIPSEEMVAIAKAMDRMQGLMLRMKA